MRLLPGRKPSQVITNADLIRAISDGFARMEYEMTEISQGVQMLQTQDADLKQQVATLLTDFANAVANAANSGDAGAIAGVVGDMQAMSAQILSADPNATPPNTTPAPPAGS